MHAVFHTCNVMNVHSDWLSLWLIGLRVVTFCGLTSVELHKIVEKHLEFVFFSIWVVNLPGHCAKVKYIYGKQCVIVSLHRTLFFSGWFLVGPTQKR